MGLKKMIKKYSDYETKELARRAAKKRKIAAYKSLTSKKKPKLILKGKLSAKAFNKSIGDPHSTTYPKAGKVLKKVKKKSRRKKVVIYAK